MADELDTKLYCGLCGSEGATLVCEDCGLILCFWCVKTAKRKLTVCQACGSLDISQGTNTNFFCLKCNSEQIGSGSKIQRRCPTCNGKIQNIFHVKKKGVSRFLEVLKIFKGIGTQFVKLCMTWEQLRARIQTLRQANYYHYPLLEDKMGSVYEKLPEDGRFVFNQVTLFAKKLKTGAGHFIGGSFRSVENVAKKMQQLSSLEKELEIVSTTVSARLRDEIEIMDHLTRLIEKIERFRDYFDQLHDTLAMDPFELPVMVLPHVQVSNFRNLDGRSNGRGVICLTNSRLVFITRQGTFRKTNQGRSLQINQIVRVSQERKKRKTRLTLTTTLGNVVIQGNKDALEEFHAFFGMVQAWNSGKIPIATVKMPSLEKVTKKYRTRLSDLGLDILNNNKEILEASKSEYSLKHHIAYLEREISVLRRTLRSLNEKFDCGYIPVERYTRLLRELLSELDGLQTEWSDLAGSEKPRMTTASGLGTIFGV